MVIADIDAFNLTNLIFAIDFVKKIKPTYTFPLFIVLKNVGPDEINVTDTIEMTGTLHLYDDPACSAELLGGSHRWDDTDGSGNFSHQYDTPPYFGYDKLELCPDDEVTATMVATWAGGAVPYDWIWAFDDGGGTDIVPLSGPDSSPPAPYGPAVGQITFDDTLAAGVYTRIKPL